jgi:hypothetical protein
MLVYLSGKSGERFNAEDAEKAVRRARPRKTEEDRAEPIKISTKGGKKGKKGGQDLIGK